MEFHPTRPRGERALLTIGIVLAALLGAGTVALAQGQYPSATAEPGFRDPATGRVYTPSNVGKDDKPVPPEDRAFDPNSQQSAGPIMATFQTPPWRIVGPVPVTAGPRSAAPAMTFQVSSLQPIQGRWVLELAVANNSSYAISPRIECGFNNGATRVQTVAVQLENVPPGQSVLASVDGPQSDRLYVDTAPCSIISQ